MKIMVKPKRIKSKTLIKLNLNEEEFGKIITQYLTAYAKACPGEEFDEHQFPNFGELDYFFEEYSELCDACMNGKDEELDKLIRKYICLWRAENVYS